MTGMSYEIAEAELFMELSCIANRGITIYLDNMRSNPFSVVKAIQVDETVTYMRDYIFDEGVLTELHFDKVANF